MPVLHPARRHVGTEWDCGWKKTWRYHDAPLNSPRQYVTRSALPKETVMTVPPSA
eukprot:CAMPEP_0174303010 /NCGR_PEP_ID=MMETSP0809-20121228/59937_1 /TAXON_ID=73025 ORGANISM="Eutreptiella gymnastica-like, Strain CCMP1594" /NCGR_SAMPLE_ID=MMETSP0809 /ASSEMBLY_ACC=CAM_ASM_000658 /LENGTH=54 /DNA_ID=CAMNT_0015408967 /DNA_START=717 /DNA_END=881 /DNA_ORIENTATION=-